MPLFRYDPAVIERFPSVVGGVLHATGLTNGVAPEPLAQAFRIEQSTVLARLGETPLSEVPSLAAWRRAFRAFGVDPTGYRSAAEALLRRLTKQGSIPSIDALVDIGNLVSIRYALPVAVFDLASVVDGLSVVFARGGEAFTDLGSGSLEAAPEGEVIFIDGDGQVAARRWCWRQSSESASSASTTDVLITVEGHHDAARRDVTAAVLDLETSLRAYAAPGRIRTGLVDRDTPGFPVVRA